MTNQQAPAALRLAEELEIDPSINRPSVVAELRRLHAENTTLQQGYDAARLEIDSLHTRVQELGAMRAQQAATVDVQATDAEIIALADETRTAEGGANGYILPISFARAVLAKWCTPQQEAQEPCPACIALARTVMLDQVSFDRKPDCYGIRQITDDEGIEEWEDIRTSPDVAREEANDMMATGRGEIYEVVPLWTTPQPAPAPLSEREAFEAWIKKDGGDLGTFGTPPNMHYGNSAVNNAWVAWKARAALAAQGGE